MFILAQLRRNVLYLIYMNKEVIYLEPEDDITDILTKLQRAEQKLVALVPPKKATMLRSAVNMKLVARAAKECDKVAVVVTSDPAIVKLAMAAQIPVAKTLQSRPVVPTPEMIKESEKAEQVIDEVAGDMSEKAELDSLKDKKDGFKTSAEASRSASEKTSEKGAAVLDLSDETLEKGGKDAKTAKDKGEKAKKAPSLDKYRKYIIIGVLAAIVLVVFGVWALVFAPAVKITVAMSTSSSNFSEDVRFTTDSNAARPEEGLLFLDKQSYEQEYTGEIIPTGREDRGNKATGSVSFTISIRPYDYIGSGFTFAIPAGTTVVATNADKRSVTYRTTESFAVSWDGAETAALSTIKCSTNIMSTCRLSETVKVEATAPGEDYNIGKGSDWNDIRDEQLGTTITVTNANAFTGGSTHDVAFISQSDLDKAKEEILTSHQLEGRDALMEQLKADENLIVIESSFTSEVGDVASSPEVNAELASDAKPEAKVKAIYSVYTINKTQVEEFIKAKAQVANDQRIYSIGEPYLERFVSAEESAKLKTVIKTGPTVTEEDILEKSRGKKIGEVQSLLRSINGVSSVDIEPSFFWVWSVPDDPEKITIDLTVEDN